MKYTDKNGKQWTLQKGPKGGYFYINDNGVKRYVKKDALKSKQISKTTTKSSPVSFKKPLTYICYYEKRIDGELVDDFKEWTEAYSLEEARNYFENEYRHNPNITISNIIKQ